MHVPQMARLEPYLHAEGQEGTGGEAVTNIYYHDP